MYIRAVLDVTPVLVFITTIIYMIHKRRPVAKGEALDAPLTRGEVIAVTVFCLLDPILTGAIFYYGWKKRLPVKSRQANRISIWAFVIEIVLGVLYLFVSST